MVYCASEHEDILVSATGLSGEYVCVTNVGAILLYASRVSSRAALDKFYKSSVFTNRRAWLRRSFAHAYPSLFLEQAQRLRTLY